MPVDDNILEEKSKIVSDELSLLINRHGNLKTIQANLNSIKMIQDSKFPRDETKKVLPDDSSVGGKISAARRQQTYDKIIADLTDLGL